MTDKKKKWLWFCLVVLPLICSRSADAISKKNVIRILVKQNKLFHNKCRGSADDHPASSLSMSIFIITFIIYERN